MRNITAKWERTAYYWRPAVNQFAILYEGYFSPSSDASPAIFPIGPTQIRDESTEHVSEVLIEAGNRNCFAA